MKPQTQQPFVSAGKTECRPRAEVEFNWLKPVVPGVTNQGKTLTIRPIYSSSHILNTRHKAALA